MKELDVLRSIHNVRYGLSNIGQEIQDVRGVLSTLELIALNSIAKDETSLVDVYSAVVQKLPKKSRMKEDDKFWRDENGALYCKDDKSLEGVMDLFSQIGLKMWETYRIDGDEAYYVTYPEG